MRCGGWVGITACRQGQRRVPCFLAALGAGCLDLLFKLQACRSRPCRLPWLAVLVGDQSMLCTAGTRACLFGQDNMAQLLPTPFTGTLVCLQLAAWAASLTQPSGA